MSADALYALQQLANGITVGCTYAVLAVGFTLILSVVNQINLAFGETFMVGAMVAAIAVLVTQLLHIGWLPYALAFAAAAAVFAAASLGWLTNRLVFAPALSARSRTLTPLIATIGLAIFLQEFVRLTQTAGNIWIRPLFSGGLRLGRPGTFSAFFGFGQMFVLGVTVAALVLLWLLVARSRFGRHLRAVSQDPGMAALIGLDVHRIVAAAFVLSGVFAGIGGFIVTVQYGVANFVMGFLMGLKAFTAAVLGGVGSLAGAALGGLLLGMIETVWSAYFPLEYRDLVTFAILIGAIVLRPEGILGRPLPEVTLGMTGAPRQ
jgi:branched-chain amino acid transport system permease protein